MRLAAPTALVALAVALLLAGIGIAFWAGCTGDTKGGSLGDPVAALQIQSFGALAALGAALAFAAAASTLRAKDSTTRVKLAIAAVLAVAMVWIVVGWEAEVQGVKQCLVER